MKNLKINKYVVMAIGLFVTIALFVFGKGHESGMSTMLTGAVVSLTDEEKAGFNENETPLS